MLMENDWWWWMEGLWLRRGGRDVLMKDGRMLMMQRGGFDGNWRIVRRKGIY